jgi:hypothetical protein
MANRSLHSNNTGDQMSFLKDYEPVANRIQKFWKDYADKGRIHTEVVLINETEIVIKASVFTDREDTRPAAVDYAQEKRGGTGQMAASAVEVCATSAIGRALATLGYSTKRSDGDFVRASREEMEKVTAGHRDYLVQASEAADNKDLETLRTIYAAAVKSQVDNNILDAIMKLADGLKGK